MNQQMMKRVQQMQREIGQIQKEIQETEFKSVSGPVTVVMFGNQELKEVVIDKNYVVEDADDLAMIGDMVVAACHQVQEEINIYTEEKMGKYKALLGGFGGF